MSEPIKEGDLVQIVRWPHEHGDHRLGHVFIVQGFFCMCHCPTCDTVFEESAAKNIDGQGVPLSWLKRIPPLDDLEQIEALKEVTA